MAHYTLFINFVMVIRVNFKSFVQKSFSLQVPIIEKSVLSSLRNNQTLYASTTHPETTANEKETNPKTKSNALECSFVHFNSCVCVCVWYSLVCLHDWCTLNLYYRHNV